MENKHQYLPPLSDDEYQALKDSIRKSGVIIPVVLDEEGEILDGHHRIKAWDELTREGVKLKDYPSKTLKGLSESGKIERILSLNLDRRHLTKEQRDELILKLRQDGLSTRAISDATKVPQQTVSRVVRKAASDPNGSVALPETVVGKDKKVRKAKQDKKVAIKELPESDQEYPPVEDRTGRRADDALAKYEAIHRHEEAGRLLQALEEAFDRIRSDDLCRILADDNDYVRRVEDIAVKASDLVDDVLMKRSADVASNVS